MPQLRPDQLASFLVAADMPAVSIPDVRAEIARARGDDAVRDGDIDRSARERPDLFFLLEPSAAGWTTTWTEEARAEYGLAESATRQSPELLLLGLPEDADADAGLPVSHALARLAGTATAAPAAGATGGSAYIPTRLDESLAEAMRDALELDRAIRCGRA